MDQIQFSRQSSASLPMVSHHDLAVRITKRVSQRVQMERTMKYFLPALLLVLAIGCKAPSQDTETASPSKPTATTAPAPAASGQEGVRPMVPGSGVPTGPVAGSESVEGAGMGGLGQSAMNRARSVAGQAGNSSASQGTPDAGENP